MEDQFYLTLSNKDSEDFYPDNSPYEFRVILDRSIDIVNQYRCALMEFTCSTTNFKEVSKEIFIFFSLVSENTKGGSSQNLARITLVKKSRLQMEKFAIPYYLKTKPANTNVVEVYIKDDKGQNASFLKDTSRCTFHFKKI